MADLGFIFLGLAVGVPLGALSAYGFMFIWAVRCGREEDAE